MKKILSVLLALCLLVGALPMAAWAESPTTLTCKGLIFSQPIFDVNENGEATDTGEKEILSAKTALERIYWKDTARFFPDVEPEFIDSNGNAPTYENFEDYFECVKQYSDNKIGENKTVTIEYTALKPTVYAFPANGTGSFTCDDILFSVTYAGKTCTITTDKGVITKRGRDLSATFDCSYPDMEPNTAPVGWTGTFSMNWESTYDEKDEKGEPVGPYVFTYDSNNKSVATVTNNSEDNIGGIVTPVKEGTTNISITIGETEYYKAETFTVPITVIAKPTPEVKFFDGGGNVINGEEYIVDLRSLNFENPQAYISARSINNRGFQVETSFQGAATYTSSDESVATIAIDSTADEYQKTRAIVAPNKVGTTTITANVAESSGYKAATKTLKLTVTHETHNWRQDRWGKNATHHWHECGYALCPIEDNSKKNGYEEHTFGEWTTDQEATADTAGSKSRKCTKCQYEETKVIPPTAHEHEWDEDWSHDAENHWHGCTVEGCEVTQDSAAHIWNDSEVTTEPTSTEKGVKTYTCTVCEATKTEEIVATGGNSGNQGNSGGSTTTPSTPTPKDEVTTTPTVSGGTASTTVSSSDGASLVEAAKQPGTGEVTVKVEPTQDVTAANVTLPASTVSGVGAAKSDLTVSTPVADITLPSETLTGLGTGASNVTVSAAVNSDETVSITVRKDNTTVTALAQPMRASIPAENVTGSTVAVLVDENGKETIIPKSISGKDEVSLLLGGSGKIKLKDNAKTFNDTQGHWAANDGSIGFATSRELFQGTSDTSFSPETTMTRGMMVTVLHRLESKPKGGSVSFGDVSTDAYFAEAVAWGNANDIVKGDGSNFLPNDNVTREQLAAFLYRYAGKYGVDTAGRTNLTSFPDSGNVSGYAKDALEWAYHTGLIKGGSDGKLNPNGSAKRGEVAAILMRFVEYINK